MTVIIELQVAPDEFELGRMMNLSEHTTVVLERMVPIGRTPVPFFRVRDEDRDTFEQTLQRQPSVERVTRLERQGDETLYALKWAASRDHFFAAMAETGAQLVSATGISETWAFEIRFPSHEALSRFHERCDEADISMTVDRIFNETAPGMGPWFGLTPEQRTTLISAVQGGYYAIPRRLSTQDLADEFGISDQAVTERLRRGIGSLVEHTLMTATDSSHPSAEE